MSIARPGVRPSRAGGSGPRFLHGPQDARDVSGVTDGPGGEAHDQCIPLMPNHQGVVMSHRRFFAAAAVLAVAFAVVAGSGLASSADAQAARLSSARVSALVPGARLPGPLRTMARGVRAGAGLGLPAGPGGSTSAARINSHPTGDPALDAYCRKVADLVNDAILQSDLALINNDPQGSQEWWDLAMYMLAYSKSKGCNFSNRIRVGAVTLRSGRGAVLAARS